MKSIIPVLLIVLIAFIVLALLVVPMEGIDGLPGMDGPTDAPQETNPYVGAFATDCEALKNYTTYGRVGVRSGWLEECLYHYELQANGHGLAIVAHPEGQDASGTNYAVMYATEDKGENWTVLHETFTYTKGRDVFVYMGKVALLAIDHAQSPSGTIMISYDRGKTWSTKLAFDALMDYDVEVYPDLEPCIINCNEHTGIITFGWKADRDSNDYLLINQFDVKAKQFTEEISRYPEFPTAPTQPATEPATENQ